MATYEESQKALRAQVPKGTPGAAELEQQGFTDVGTQPIDTSQPAPTGDLTKVPTQSVGPGGEKIYDVFAGQEHIADPNDPRLKGVDIAGLPEGQAPETFKSKFETGFQQANQALGDAAGDVKDGSVVNKYSPQKQSNVKVDNFFATNPFIQQSSQQMMEFLSPQSTRDSLKTYMDQVIADKKELAGLKLEFMSNKRVMEGTADQLREEIQKAGGFGTETQIQALAISRNRTLIQRNSQLADLIQSQQDAINTDVQLLTSEKQFAQNEFTNRMSILNYQQENSKFMFNAIKDTYKTLMDKDPTGLYNSLIADPVQAQRFQSVTGIGTDTLKSLSDQQEAEKLRTAQKDKTFGSVDLGNRVAILDNSGKVIRYENKGPVPKSGTGTGDDVSDTTQAIIDNPSLFDDLTPTEKGRVIAQLQANGYDTSNLGVKGLSDTAIGEIAQTQKALADLATLKIKMSDSKYVGPVKGFARLNPFSDARKIQADVDRVRQTVGKALEGGVLRKEDEEKYKKILATLSDTPSTAVYKIDALIGSIQRDIENYKRLQQSSGKSLDVGAPLQKKETKTSPTDFRSKYNY